MPRLKLAVLALALLSLLVTVARAGDPWVTYDGFAGPGKGVHIVLVSGDEEYRSEEALPQLGKILAVRHGFKCTVLFAIDPATGAIDPDNQRNIPGLEALATADALVIATRFRNLPDEQMAHVDAFLRSGKPVIGLRTATHAFALEDSQSYARYSWNHGDADFAQGFGRQILGETWIAHHGTHGQESTRGVAAPGEGSHPVLRGIQDGDIWGPTDVYRVRLPLPEPCQPIVLGQVLAGMNAGDEPVEGEQNAPPMPVAWTSAYSLDGGPEGRVFTTTMGAATDLVAEGTRRMVVQGIFWALGLADAIPDAGLDVRLIGTYEPTPYGFGGARKGVLPEAHALEVGANDPPWDPDDGLELRQGEKLLVIGNAFADRMAQAGYLDALAHAAHADRDVVVRTIGWAADEVGLRPRELNVPTIEDWVDEFDPDSMLLCYGMSESFGDAEARASFERDLETLLDRCATKADGTPRRLVLVSPIAHQDLGGPWPTGAELEDHNRAIREISSSMRSVAESRGCGFVDLFTSTHDGIDVPGGLTANGIHLTEAGAQAATMLIGRRLGWYDGPERPSATPEEVAAAERLRLYSCDKQYMFRLTYRPTNTEYVWGRRAEPFGVVNFPPEWEQLERMIGSRERAIHGLADLPREALFARAPGEVTLWETLPSPEVELPEDEWTPTPVAAQGTETSLGDLDILDPEEFAASFTLAPGYTIECFASEQDFPELQNPLALTFDDRGRLWVACTPTYPHLLPGEHPRCVLLILEDTNGDGRADERTVFADRLYIPTGFAVDTDAVYVGQAPDLLRLRDLDGDDVADRREIVATGFAMPDSHHQISAFEWTPGGGILLNEGVFAVSSIETPYGTRRTRDAAVWRFDPRTERLEVLSHCSFSNPWGHAFADFGDSILADASGGDNYAFSHVVHAFEYPRKPERPGRILNRGRPTAGCELISSRHFPDDVQDSFLVNQSIGFHGTRWDRMIPDGSSWRPEKMPADLISCTDTNFRPVAMEVGPDGALYVVDWCNPIIGHMQYSVRDPRRDHTHGRIWRVRHETRDLVVAPRLHDASVPELLEHLRLPERNTRQLARRRLQKAPADQVFPVLATWLSELDPNDPDRDRLVLDALWLHQAHGRTDLELLGRVQMLYEPRARAGAVRVLRHWLQSGAVAAPAATPFLTAAVVDPDMRVRLEGVIACGFLPATVGVDVAARAAELPMDGAMTTVLCETLRHLDPSVTSSSELVRRLLLERMSVAELREQVRDEIVLSVLLARDELSMEERSAALFELAGELESDHTALLIAELERARTDRGVLAIGDLLLAMSRKSLSTAGGTTLEAATRSGSSAIRLVAMSVLMKHDRLPQGGAGLDADELLAAMARLEPGDAPAASVALAREHAQHDDGDTLAAIAQVVRHSDDRAGAFAWLAELVDSVESRPLSTWDREHELAMAALRGMHRISPAEWPDGYEHYRIGTPSDEVLNLGREVYSNEEGGCIRCHGADGRGLEGFPALDRSPWLMGNPERSASIVVHGLFGALEMPDGSKYASAMAPLGASLDDEQIAAVLTYARRSWGNYASPVSAADVVRARAAAPARGGLWEIAAMAAAYPLAQDGLVFQLPPPTQPVGVDRASFAIAILIAFGVGLLIVAAVLVTRRRTEAR